MQVFVDLLPTALEAVGFRLVGDPSPDAPDAQNTSVEMRGQCNKAKEVAEKSFRVRHSTTSELRNRCGMVCPLYLAIR